MILLSTRNRAWMSQCEAALMSQGIDSHWTRASGPGLFLDVATSEAERASDILSLQLAEELKQPRSRFKRVGSIPLFLQPPFVMGMGLAALTLTWFGITGGADARTLWFAKGALFRDAAFAGEVWRLVTAATLHADPGHALGNAGFLLVLGWAAAERLGPGAAVWVWLVAAISGFLASLGLGEAQLTVGASGGLFGLLGVAAGHATRNVPVGITPFERRRERIRALGAGLMLLAFSAFSPRSNVYAHIGGFLSGLAFGFVAPRRPAGRGFQAAMGFGALAVLVLAWRFASRS